jgi:hypothetical protein
MRDDLKDALQGPLGRLAARPRHHPHPHSPCRCRTGCWRRAGGKSRDQADPVTPPGTGKEPLRPHDREELIFKFLPDQPKTPPKTRTGLHNELLTWPDAMIIWWAILGSNQ